MTYEREGVMHTILQYKAQKDSVFIHSLYYLLFQIYLWFSPSRVICGQSNISLCWLLLSTLFLLPHKAAVNRLSLTLGVHLL